MLPYSQPATWQTTQSTLLREREGNGGMYMFVLQAQIARNMTGTVKNAA